MSNDAVDFNLLIRSGVPTRAFKQGETILTEWLVESKEDGEVQIVETLKSLVDDDDDEDGDDDD